MQKALKNVSWGDLNGTVKGHHVKLNLSATCNFIRLGTLILKRFFSTCLIHLFLFFTNFFFISEQPSAGIFPFFPSNAASRLQTWMFYHLLSKTVFSCLD